MRVLESKSAFADSTETVNCRYDAKPTTLQSESELKQFFGATAEIGVMCRNYDKRSNHLDVCNQQVRRFESDCRLISIVHCGSRISGLLSCVFPELHRHSFGISSALASAAPPAK